jgi:hypothetical protein
MLYLLVRKGITPALSGVPDDSSREANTSMTARIDLFWRFKGTMTSHLSFRATGPYAPCIARVGEGEDAFGTLLLVVYYLRQALLGRSLGITDSSFDSRGNALLTAGLQRLDDQLTEIQLASLMRLFVAREHGVAVLSGLGSH